MLLPPSEALLGSVVHARILSASRWSVTGAVVPEARHQPSPALGQPGDKQSGTSTAQVTADDQGSLTVSVQHAADPQGIPRPADSCGAACSCVDSSSSIAEALSIVHDEHASVASDRSTVADMPGTVPGSTTNAESLGRMAVTTARFNLQAGLQSASGTVSGAGGRPRHDLVVAESPDRADSGDSTVSAQSSTTRALQGPATDVQPKSVSPAAGEIAWPAALSVVGAKPAKIMPEKSGMAL